MCVTAPQQWCKVYLATPDGSSHNGDLEVLIQGSVLFPDSGVYVHIRPADAVVWGTAGEVNIDCTGLSGHDLGAYALTNIVSQFMALQ